jgi:hypothetical protein
VALHFRGFVPRKEDVMAKGSMRPQKEKRKPKADKNKKKGPAPAAAETPVASAFAKKV